MDFTVEYIVLNLFRKMAWAYVSKEQKKRMIRCDSDKAFGVIAKVGDL